MTNNQGNHLGAINVKQSRELTFQFSVLSRDKSALFCALLETPFQRVLSLKSSLMMSMLRHQAETGRLVSELAFGHEVFDQEQIEDIQAAWKKLSKLDLAVSYCDSYKEQLEAIARRPAQSELAFDRVCKSADADTADEECNCLSCQLFKEPCEKEDAPFLPSSQECSCRSCQIAEAAGALPHLPHRA